MDNKFSDEQVDRILRQIVKDSVLSDEEIIEIVDSPMLWRKVQNNINQSKTSRQKGWIPTWLDWRIAVFASAVLVVCFGLFWFANSRGNENLAEVKAVELLPVEITKNDSTVIPNNAPNEENKQLITVNDSKKTSPTKIVPSKNKQKPDALPKITKGANHSTQIAKSSPKAAEIKTDFIALNYSPAAESGQILKVKVPRSMMVSLGVSTKVENSSELVNAEILVGDDGLARAIRFIQ